MTYNRNTGCSLDIDQFTVNKTTTLQLVNVVFTVSGPCQREDTQQSDPLTHVDLRDTFFVSSTMLTDVFHTCGNHDSELSVANVCLFHLFAHTKCSCLMMV